MHIEHEIRIYKKKERERERGRKRRFLPPLFTKSISFSLNDRGFSYSFKTCMTTLVDGSIEREKKRKKCIHTVHAQ